MARRRYLGIDPTGSQGRPSGYALIDDRAELVEVGAASTDTDILALADRFGPTTIAIDAPLSWPADLGDPACEGRPCEIELARQGIGIYRTTAKTIIPRLVDRGISLARRFREAGFAVIEVYPYASKVRLFGRPIPKKTTPAGLDWLRRRLDALVPGLGGRGPLTHDELDAVVAAYTAYLFGAGRAEEVGDAAEGSIVVPLPAGSPPDTARPVHLRRAL